jgi:hypothetical protein
MDGRINVQEMEAACGFKEGRINRLLDRGNALSLNLSSWKKLGIWWITRSDEDYPEILKKNLGGIRPPLFFGYGSKENISGPLTAVNFTKGLSRDFRLTEEEKARLKLDQPAHKIVGRLSELKKDRGVEINVGVESRDLIGLIVKREYGARLKSKSLTLISFNPPKKEYALRTPAESDFLMNSLAETAVFVGCTSVPAEYDESKIECHPYLPQSAKKHHGKAAHQDALRSPEGTVPASEEALFTAPITTAEDRSAVSLLPPAAGISLQEQVPSAAFSAVSEAEAPAASDTGAAAAETAIHEDAGAAESLTEDAVPAQVPLAAEEAETAAAEPLKPAENTSEAEGDGSTISDAAAENTEAFAAAPAFPGNPVPKQISPASGEETKAEQTASETPNLTTETVPEGTDLPAGASASAGEDSIQKTAAPLPAEEAADSEGATENRDISAEESGNNGEPEFVLTPDDPWPQPRSAAKPEKPQDEAADSGENGQPAAEGNPTEDLFFFGFMEVMKKALEERSERTQDELYEYFSPQHILTQTQFKKCISIAVRHGLLKKVRGKIYAV